VSQVQAVRVAALLTLSDDPAAAVVSGEAMRVALVLLDHLTEHARRAHQAGRDTRQTGARRVLRYLRTLGCEYGGTPSIHSQPPSEGGSEGYEGVTVSTRDVHQRFRENSWCQAPDDAREALLDLADLGWLRGPLRETGPKGGRPSERWAVNPAAFRTPHDSRL
jgi:hypothetical protein